MSILKAGPLRVHVSGKGEGPAVLLCHGFGAPGDDLVPLARAIDAGPGVRWFFPEAPLSIELGFGMQGRAWWMIDIERIQRAIASGRRRDFPTDDVPEGMAESRAALDECIDSLVRDHGVDPTKLVIGGFSQGAMLTTDLALDRRHAYAGSVVLSGALVAAKRWKEALAKNGKELHVLQSHGRQDPLLPFDVAESLHSLFESSGASVEWIPFDGQHEIPARVLDRLGPFLQRRLHG